MDLVEVHPLLCSRVPEACSSTYQPGSATKHFVVPHPHVYFFRPAAAVEDVPGRASPLPIARLGRRSLYPVTFIRVRSVIHTLFIVQYFNAINGKCTYLSVHFLYSNASHAFNNVDVYKLSFLPNEPSARVTGRIKVRWGK
ncbi:hypothetical protein HanIR_Chr09g0445681 [Helianthus annuus]|nr:hypothetical protein HanIR_Chr09g0445681 [Helianthus annuus]